MTDSFCPKTDHFRATNYRELCRRIAEKYGLDEARAIVRLVLGERFGLSMADILCDKVTELSADDRTELEKIMLRLENGEPVQYVLGFAEFCDRRFSVGPEVLIPRPDTEELCRWMSSGVQEFRSSGVQNEGDFTILDIGTGSGCIAITLAAELPDAQVSAWDISEKALATARKNADFIGVNVDFEQIDILNDAAKKTPLSNGRGAGGEAFDIIVSNPPYVCQTEKSSMKPHVLEYEPHVALFVPDDDPLLFYRAIADFAVHALKPNGWLYFELNPLYINDLKTMLSERNFDEIEEKCDQFGKKRMIRAKKSRKLT
ncbi:MAG: peptide chain release factor N(5)-glutamine methyltransferase [Prevotella sp.]|nr:peptide chain release factor N(5)-glutamine methyltransferase [Prevotella sp.]